ncbi:unnamed protein product, partial [Discosporangium mesarthrocarpum]
SGLGVFPPKQGWGVGSLWRKKSARAKGEVEGVLSPGRSAQSTTLGIPDLGESGGPRFARTSRMVSAHTTTMLATAATGRKNGKTTATTGN